MVVLVMRSHGDCGLLHGRTNMSTYITKGAITEVSLTNSNKVFVIDSDQEGVVRQVRSWSLNNDGHVRGHHPVHGMILVHRLLMLDALEESEIEKPCVDHINRDPLDNRISNLRLVNRTTNNRSKRVSGKSRFPGVSWHKQKRKWRAQITVDRKQIHLGLFACEQDAARAYRAAFKKLDDVADYEEWKELDATAPGQTQITNYFNYNQCTISNGDKS
jgi:hypothetical protein